LIKIRAILYIRNWRKKKNFEGGFIYIKKIIEVPLIGYFSISRFFTCLGPGEDAIHQGGWAPDGIARFWRRRIFWVRSVVCAMKVGETDAVKVVEENAVNNQKTSLCRRSLYGKEAGDKLFDLPAGHYGSIKEYHKGARKQKDAEVAKAKKNAEESAAFLAHIRPYFVRSPFFIRYNYPGPQS
jgi:hypothetical protein